jgi:hypothetical protein
MDARSTSERFTSTTRIEVSSEIEQLAGMRQRTGRTSTE